MAQQYVPLRGRGSILDVGTRLPTAADVQPPGQRLIYCCYRNSADHRIRGVVSVYVAEGTIYGRPVMDHYNNALDEFFRWHKESVEVSDFADPAWFLNTKTLKLHCPKSPFAMPPTADWQSHYYLTMHNVPIFSIEAGWLMEGGAIGKRVLAGLGIKPIRIEKVRLRGRFCAGAYYKKD